MNGLFKKLEDEAAFVEFVETHYRAVPGEISKIMWCKPQIDKDRLRYAHREYTQNIGKFALYLHSSNPDQYKRAGALLHALYKAAIIRDLGLESNSEDLEGGLSRVTDGDAQHMLPFLKFWEAYHNQALAFDIAYGCCASYETAPRPYSFEYLHNMCRFLKESPDLSIDTCFMIFKSLMA